METKLLTRLLDTARTVTPLATVTAAAFELPEDEARETLRGQVAARLPDGTFRVVVADRTLQLALPAGVKPGDIVQLRVLGRQADAAGRAASAQAAAGGGLSSAGQLIGALLGEVPGSPPRQAQPVLSLPPAAPAELPAPLARAVERSGVFYESHQARWVNGDYPLERLLEEPQVLLTRAAQPPEADEAPVPGSATTAAQPPALQGRDPALELAAQKAGTLAHDNSLESPRTEVAARETLPIIRQQLDTLDSRQFSWLGEIWPGQSMRWEIAEDDSSRPEHEEQGDWKTRFALTLPALGDVGAELALSGSGVRIALSARNADVARSLQAAAAELAQALEAAGVATTAIQVTCGEPPV